MTTEPGLIVQLPRGGAVDRQFRADPPPSVASGRVVLDHVRPGADGRLEPPEGGEIVMSVLSPEALAREAEEVRDVIKHAPDDHEPLVIIVEAAEELREEEIAVVMDAAARAHRRVIVRVMADA
ncbi:MAG TPA: hypothetical protein VLW44_16485 [Streptosporangiaceae bacterium]|nr:hypothetical protein [Streptosporangiaceae bacterium]